jgi:hypothetical protein
MKAEIIREAARLIREVGWVRGSFRELDPMTNEPLAFCAYGAIRQAAGLYSGALSYEMLNERCNLVIYAVRDVIEIHLLGGRSIVEYNDNLSRTKEEVISLLENAAELVETL